MRSRALAVLAFAAACPRAAALVVYYNVFQQTSRRHEQLHGATGGPIWDEVDEIRYSTIGKGKMRNHVARICEVATVSPPREPTKRATRSGARPLPRSARRTLRNVAYLHDKGSFRNVFHSQVRARQNRGCCAGSATSAASRAKGDACDVLLDAFRRSRMHALRFGNMWLARCSYVKRLAAPPSFQKGMDAYWGTLGFDKGGTLMGTPWVGTGRYAWSVHSHPSVRPPTRSFWSC